MASKARGLADLGNAFNDGALSNRNLIINGAMQVAQRGTSFTSPASGNYTLDRWMYEKNSNNVVTIEQSSDAPDEYTSSIKVTTTTADGSTGASDFSQLLYQLEGQDISRLAYGTSAAKDATLSFWVKSSVTGSFPFSLQNHNGSRVFPVTYTVNSANTWEYKTISIAGDTGGTWVTSGNTLGLRFTFLWISGSNYTGGTDGGGWAATSGYANLTSTYTANLDVVNATLQITGVQLEVGDTATPFEHRSYGQELALCQRYFEKSYNQGTYAGASGASAGFYKTGGGAGSLTTGYLEGGLTFRTNKRATPSVVVYDYNGNTNKVERVNPGIGSTNNENATVALAGEGGFAAYSPSGGIAGYINFHWTADAEL